MHILKSGKVRLYVVDNWLKIKVKQKHSIEHLLTRLDMSLVVDNSTGASYKQSLLQGNKFTLAEFLLIIYTAMMLQDAHNTAKNTGGRGGERYTTAKQNTKQNGTLLSNGWAAVNLYANPGSRFHVKLALYPAIE